MRIQIRKTSEFQFDKEVYVVRNLFNILGWLILIFVIVSNRIDIPLSDGIVIALCIISAIFLCIGIIMNRKK